MPVRIYDIAKKFGIESIAVIAKAKQLGIDAKVPSSSLDRITAEFLESHFVPAEPPRLPDLKLLPLPVEPPQMPPQASPVSEGKPQRQTAFRDDSYGIRLSKDAEVEIHAFEEDDFRHVGSFAFVVGPEKTQRESAAGGELEKVVLITNSESASLEFKAAARWDIYQERDNPDLKFAIVKTVASFLNTDGGVLLIGVADNGRVLGLKEDFGTLQKPKADDYLLFLTNLFCNAIGPGLNYCVQSGIRSVGGKDVCVVRVRRSPKPVFIREEQHEQFYARIGNSSRSLPMSAAVEHIQLRWGIAAGQP